LIIEKLKVRVVFLLALLLVVFFPHRFYAQFSAQRRAKAKELYEQALEYEKNDQFREAVEKAKELIKNYPVRTYIPNTYLLLGLCYENLYDFAKALRYYRKLLHGFPNYKIAKIARYKEDLIKKTYKLEKKPLIIFIKQERFVRKGYYNKAVQYCRQILADYPHASLADNAQNTISYIRMNYLKQYNGAISEYKKILSSYPDSNFRDNALFAIGRCLEHLELYQSSLAYYSLLKKRHEGGFLPKTNYWSRVWYTKSSDRLEKVVEKMQKYAGKPFALDSFVESPFEVCLNDKRGEDTKSRNIKTWITPEAVKKLIGKEVMVQKFAVFFTDQKATTLNIWNYILSQYDNLDDTGLEDYWQFPAETHALKTGDEEDLCFLLSSLLVASGMDSENVRVGFGKDSEGGVYRCVYIKDNDEWYLLNVDWKGTQKELRLAKYERYNPEYAFNDKVLLVSPVSPVRLSRCQ
jgi:TolA-binding protein/predicted transglutaminase-like cysteine proteinase